MNGNSLTNYLKAQKRLRSLGQQALLASLPLMFKKEQKGLIQEILRLDLKKIQKQKALFNPLASKPLNLLPYTNLIHSGNSEKIQRGQKAIKDGQCGALLIAGGQGTRLGHPGPKGTFPITPIYHKSLFQIFCEKIKKSSLEAKRSLPLAIMTSPSNDMPTRHFFAQHHYFGLNKEQVFFFMQKMLPLLDFEGQLFLSDQHKLALGPDGNGGCLREFIEQGLFAQWKNQGIEYLNLFLVDNPLADPYDPELFGELILSNADISLKSCRRNSPEEKVGILLSENQKPRILEYHEVPKEMIFEKEPAANLGLFALTFAFAQKVSQIDLPLHKVAKKSPQFDLKAQKIIRPHLPNCWKFETYLFDILPHSEKTTVLIYPREEIFCPLKNKEGDFSPEFVKKALLKRGIE